jgi:hypothetical protein
MIASDLQQNQRMAITGADVITSEISRATSTSNTSPASYIKLLASP